MDPRFQQFADTLVNYSVGVKPGDRVLIHAYDNTPIQMMEATARAVAKAGGIYAFWWDNHRLDVLSAAHASPMQVTYENLGRLAQIAATDCNIIFRGFTNPFESSGIPAQLMKIAGGGIAKAVKDVRVSNTRWILTRMWTSSMAQSARMSTEAFTDFYLRTVLIDYARMSEAMNPLVELMGKSDVVEIKGPGTDLKFSMKGIPIVKCDGHRNIPDGEVYTAPVRNSINGTITYNTATVMQGMEFSGISFTFEDGRIVKATCQGGNQERLNTILDTDEGARYVGEFAIGVNPMINKPILDTLFDEKIAGSLHLTPGQCYEVAPNGNNSDIHWDLVLIQTPEFGGGEIRFDGVLVRKDGRFILPELEGLNPDKLLG
ncbi:MAG: aminopeptidase [Patescibacteria group bacterium]